MPGQRPALPKRQGGARAHQGRRMGQQMQRQRARPLAWMIRGGRLGCARLPMGHPGPGPRWRGQHRHSPHGQKRSPLRSWRRCHGRAPRPAPVHWPWPPPVPATDQGNGAQAN
uniref:Uncharacterized protein n=1 Tax=Magnetospirillum gryphiswaldense TaxID=55518 RepID=A4U5L4_9PROT|nr:hypothetical protein MGR_4239 [Magnetospirillum gryphiswaldense MSR-1]